MWDLLLSCFALLSIFTCNNADKSKLSNTKGKEVVIERVRDEIVYDKGTHAAFTSLEEWNGDLYLAFREARAHRATDTDKGIIRILKKTKGGWILQHTFEVEGVDLRDPYFLKWNGDLYIYTLGFVSKLTDKGWTDFKKIHHNAHHYIWIWKIREYKNTLYGVGYANNEWPILLKSKNGIDWSVITTFKIGGCASEADLIFIKNKMYISLRIDKPIGSNSMWGCGKYPFTDFNWNMMPVSISSPEMIYLPESKMILLSGREYQSKSIDVQLISVNTDGSINRKVKIDVDKSGDKGYPSFCYHNGKLYMSYYVGNDTQTSVRITTFRLK